MINLTSLSALLRTLRQSGGPEAPAAPVARIVPVASLTPEDHPGSGSAGTAVQAWVASRAKNPVLLDDELIGAAAHARRTPAQALQGEALVAAGRSARLAAAATPEADIEGAPLELTGVGKVLQAVLRAGDATSPMPPAIVSNAPLVANAQSGAVDLARGLARSIAESGLFYESHLARWVRRDYPASALGREPQAAWPEQSVAALGVESTPGAATALPEATSALLTRQLDALDTRALVWSGELWRGQRATIVLEEDRSNEARGDDTGATATASAWRTRVVLDLPSLGRVEATLALAGESLSLKLATESPHANARLMAAQGALAAALAGGRVSLGSFAVAVGAET